MLFFNFIITVFSLWLIIHLNHKYLQPALKNKDRFKLYRLRDDLSLLAMRGEIDETCKEYLMLLFLINSSIRATSSFKVTDFLRFVFRMHKDEDVKKQIRQVSNRLKSHENPKYCKIASSFFLVMQGILRRDTRSLRYLFIPALFVFARLISLIRLSKKPTDAVYKKRRVINDIDNELDGYSNKFKDLCTS